MLAAWIGIFLRPDRLTLVLAEESGLVLPLSLWVLRRAARQLVEWRRAGLPLVPIAINLCEAQLRQPGFPKILAQLLAEEGLESRWLDLEFTESALMQDTEHNLAVLTELKAMGVGITLDDFGVGYSNLNILRRLPVSTLKIDRSLVSDVTRCEDDAVIVDAIISMARSMHLKVVAEGVETADQAGFFKERACAEIQGHYFSKPVAAGDVVEKDKTRDFLPKHPVKIGEKLEGPVRLKGAVECETTKIYIYDAVDRMEFDARRALARIAEGDMLRTQLSMLRRFLKRTPADTIGLKRLVADRALELGRYPFS